MKLKLLILGIIVSISILFSYYMIEKTKYAHSEAVFVATDSLTNLSFKLKGEIIKMTKQEGDKIKKGELLASLDTKTLNAKLKEILFNINSIKNNLKALILNKEKLYTQLTEQLKIAKNSYNQAQIQLQALQYKIIANQQTLKKLKNDTKKFHKLYILRKISFDKYDQIKTKFLYLKNMINAQKKDLQANKIGIKNLNNKILLIQNEFTQIKILKEKIKSIKNKILSLAMIKKEIQIKLNESNLYAPFNGIIAKKFLNPYWVVDAGNYVYSIVNPKNIYIKVLLSERKLKGIKIGNKAIITIDAFGDKKFYGKVYDIAPVSASTFSLVPRDIASGEFTKLDQRFIVKIRLNKLYPNLRIGMGGEVKIMKN